MSTTKSRGKSFIGKRFGNLVVVEFKGMLTNADGKRESVWRANCDCDPNGKQFLFETIRLIKHHRRCSDCRAKTDKRRKEKSK